MINKILKQYNINEVNSIKKFKEGVGEGSFCVSAKNKKYVLKIMAGNNKSADIMFRINFINYLRINKFATNKIIKNKDGQFLTENNKSEWVLMEYMKGHTVPWQKIEKTIAIKLAIIISILYKLSLKYYKQNKVLNNLNDESFLSIDRIMKKKLKQKVNFSNIRKSIIHSDISRENIIINGTKIKAIIDFDDLQFNYLIWDYAALLTQIFVTKSYGIDWDALKTFHSKFISCFKWSDSELTMIMPLMIYRNKLIYKEVSKKPIQNKKTTSILRSVEYKIKLIESSAGDLIKIFQSSK